VTDKSKDEYWEEILNDIDMDFIPLEYINTVIVRFVDGKEWEIDINKTKQSTDDVDSILEEFFTEYDDTIDKVDFRLDTERLKKDIQKRTTRFLKVNK
jgi:acid phosphatase class B